MFSFIQAGGNEKNAVPKQKPKLINRAAIELIHEWNFWPPLNPEGHPVDELLDRLSGIQFFQKYELYIENHSHYLRIRNKWNKECFIYENS